MRFYNPVTGVVVIRRIMRVNNKRGHTTVKNENIGLEGVQRYPYIVDIETKFP